MSDTPFPAYLQTQRLDAGLTMRQLAKRCGLDTSTISRFEHGNRHPTRDTANLLARELNVPRYEFLRIAGFWSAPPDMPLLERLQSALDRPNLTTARREILIDLVENIIDLADEVAS